MVAVNIEKERERVKPPDWMKELMEFQVLEFAEWFFQNIQKTSKGYIPSKRNGLRKT